MLRKVNAAQANVNNNHDQSSRTTSIDSLPKPFVLSMKKLFDILDDQHSGYVKLTDIEKGWQDDGSKGLPRGVIGSLRKVTPPSGLLSFERFCAGLKLCLLRNQQTSENVTQTPHATLPLPVDPLPCRMAASEMDCDFSATPLNIYTSPPPPPKPPRAPIGTTSCSRALKNSNTNTENFTAKAEIRQALQNWQMNILFNELDTNDKNKNHNHNQFEYRGLADGDSSSTTPALQAKETSTKRREPRRHTLQNGIDYNMLKRLKLYEEEQEILLLGLDAVEKARDWFMEQVLNVQEKIKYFGRLDTSFEPFTEVHQERLNFQRARVFEANRTLANLASTWERGVYPFHINLAIRAPNSKTKSHLYTSSNTRVYDPTPALLTTGTERLEQQNRHLTSEINLKSDRIALEREKQTLLTELYELQRRIEITRKNRNVTSFVLSQPSPVSQSSSVLDDADVVY